MGSVWCAAHGSESCSMLHSSGLPASKGAQDYLCCSLLIALVQINSTLNGTLRLSAFLTGFTVNQHLLMENNTCKTGRHLLLTNLLLSPRIKLHI